MPRRRRAPRPRPPRRRPRRQDPAAKDGAAKAPSTRGTKAAGKAAAAEPQVELEALDSVGVVEDLDTEPDLEGEPVEDLEIDAADLSLDDLEEEVVAGGDEVDIDPAEAEDEAVVAAAPAVNAPAEEDEEIAEPTEKDKASGDFVWDEEESEALRQARKDAELTASADSVRAYLKQIGKVALLNAEEEVDLAKRIEAGLYATQLMPTTRRRARSCRPRSAATCCGSAATASARRTTCSKPTCGWSCRWPSATPAAAWRSST